MNISKIREQSLFTAIKTPFNRNGKIDIAKYDSLVEEQIAAGVDGLIVAGTTGEGHLLDWEEHLMLISHSSNKFAEKLTIVGNTGSNNTREAIRATEYGFASGMHASLQINPYYGKTDESGIYKHIELNLDKGPAFIYNVPGRTGQDIPTQVMEKLSHHDNFIGVKECAGNERIAHYEAQGIACWSGNDDECFVGKHRFNSHGVISVASNLVPGLMRKLMDDAAANDINEKLQPLFDWLFALPNPMPLNTALALTGAVDPVIRLPYLPLSEERRNQFAEIISTLSLTDVVGNQLLSLKDDEFYSII